MEEHNKVYATSIYIPAERKAKLDRVALARGVNRNQLINQMIDGLEEVEVPPVRVTLPDSEKVSV